MQMEEEHTIIDGDILETEFDNLGEVFNRFIYVIVCHHNAQAFRAVPFMYVRTISRVREGLQVVPVDNHPEYALYSVKGELLQMVSLNPAAFCSLIDKQDAIIPAL